jgi:hypothetical protein
VALAACAVVSGAGTVRARGTLRVRVPVAGVRAVVLRAVLRLVSFVVASFFGAALVRRLAAAGAVLRVAAVVRRAVAAVVSGVALATSAAAAADCSVALAAASVALAAASVADAAAVVAVSPALAAVSVALAAVSVALAASSLAVGTVFSSVLTAVACARVAGLRVFLGVFVVRGLLEFSGSFRSGRC